MKALLDFPTHPFDYVFLMDALQAYHYPRNKINTLLKSGEIVRVKKGLYSLDKAPADKKLCANLIYGPSYISL